MWGLVSSLGGLAFLSRRRIAAAVVVAVVSGGLALFATTWAFAGSPPPRPLICPPAPQMSTAPVLSPAAVNQPKSQQLSTTNGTWTGCNQPFTYLPAWYWSTSVNGTLNPIPGATLNTFTPTNYVGDYIFASVAVCDITEVCNGARSQDGSGNTGYVYVPPPPTISPTGSGQNANATPFTATHTTWAGSPTYHFQWLRNGTAISGATSSTYTANCSSDAGTTLSVEVDATTAKGTGGWVTSTSNPQFTPCNTTAPTVSPSGTGQTAAGSQQFSAGHGTWAGSPTSYAYQWLSNGSPASGSGATTATYTPSCANDGGATLTVEVKATNSYGTSGWKVSSSSAQFVPCNTTAPTLNQDGAGLSVGQALSTSNGTWHGATSYSYAWLRDGSAISGATGSSYTTTASDVSHCITAKVTATNSYGSASTTTSDSGCVDNHLGPGGPYTFWSQPIDDRESLSVNVGNGNLVLGANDLQLAGMAGFDLNFPRTYNSLYSATQDLAVSQPANGWQTVASLHAAANGDVWFTDATGAESPFVKNGSAYTPPAGVDAQLAKNSDGSYTLTFDASNEQLNFNSSGVLQSNVDANGNTIAFTWSSGQLGSIQDSLGHTTSFTYTSGKLTTITDPGNRTYNYGYDANGNLTSFTDPTNAVTKYGYDSSGRLNQVTDPDGNMTQVAYDSSGRVYTVTRGLNSSGSCPVGSTCPVTSFLYAQPGGTFCQSPNTETDVTDPNMHTTRYCSDSLLRAVGNIDPLGNPPTLTSYSAGGSGCTDNQPCSTTDPNQNTTDLSYGASGAKPQDLTSATISPQGAGSTTPLSATYKTPSNQYLPDSSVDALGNTTSCQNTQGCVAQHTTTYAYSGSNLTSESDPSNDNSTQDAPTTTYQYDSHGRIQNSVSPNGNAVACAQNQPSTCGPYTTSYTYISTGTGAGLLGSVTTPGSPTNPAGDTTSYSYDTVGRKTSEVDPNGNVSGGNPAAHTTVYTYDGDDRLLSVTDQLNHTTTYTYDGDGNQLTVTDANNHTTTSHYNALNQLASVTKPDPDGSGPLPAPITTYTYDAAGNKASENDPDNHTTNYTYDADNRLASQTDALGNETTYTYDGDGNLLTTVDPRGNVTGCGCASQYTTTNTYDDMGNLLSTTDPLGNETTYTYDGDGNQQNTVDPRGNTTSCQNTQGCPAQHTTAKLYYPSGLLEQVTAPDGGVTKYTYDADGNMLTRTDANNHTTTYTYDNADELASVSTQLGNKTTYTYDADGNKLTMVDGNGNATGCGCAAAHTTTYAYDAANRLTSISYGDGTTPNVSYGLDPVGNRSSMTDGAGTVNYSYDNDDELLSYSRGSDTFSYTYDAAGNVTSRTYPGGSSATYGYNADEELGSVTSGGQATNYSYTPDSELYQTNLPNGYVETRTYDHAGQLTEVNNARSGTVLSDFAYTLDPDGNPTQVVQTGAVSSTTTYQYDNNNRLIDACYQATCSEAQGSSDPYIHYVYDLVGNRTSEARPTGTTSYAYNADNELCATSTTGTASCASATYTYDHDGNETSNGSRTLTFDLANHLIATTSGGTTTNYAYDGDGNRLSATSGGTTTSYLWDTNNSLPQLALERNGSGTLRSYLYGVQRISMTSGGNAYYYLYDALDSVVNLTSAAGVTEWTDSYEPFGAIRIQTENDPNAPANPMLFTGEFLDGASGLYDLRARDYDPTIGRFLTTDPVNVPEGPSVVPDSLTSGTRNGESAYSYASDAPTTAVDPSGLYWIKVIKSWKLSHHTADSLGDRLLEGGITAEALAPYLGAIPAVGEILSAIGEFGGDYAEGLGSVIKSRNDVPKSRGVTLKVGIGSPHWYIPPYPGYYEVTPRLRHQ
jgi:RHS repeat-associated protein